MKIIKHIKLWLALFVAGLPGFAQEKPSVSFQMSMGRETLLATDKQTAVIRVSLKAPVLERKGNRPPVNIGIVLDASGSMSGEKIQKAKEGALEALSRLNRSDRFSAIVYSSTARVLIPATNPQATPSYAETIKKLSVGGSTALFAGVSLGASELRKGLETHGVHRLILLSDGLANVGPDSPEELGRLGQALSKEGIAVATVGLGNSYNEDLMTRLSQGSEGNTYYVENSRDLPRIFQQELGDVLNVYAQEVVVDLSFPPNVKPIAILGRQGSVSSSRVRVPLKQIYGGQEKFVMVEVEVLNGKVGETREMAVAKLNYLPLDSAARIQQSASVNASFSELKSEVYASRNKMVQRDAELMSNTAVVDEALSLQAEGKNDVASEKLLSSASRLNQVADENDDEVLRQKASEMEAYAADIKSRRLDRKRRKVLKTLNYQSQSQQTSYSSKGDSGVDAEWVNSGSKDKNPKNQQSSSNKKKTPKEKPDFKKKKSKKEPKKKDQSSY